MDDRLTVPPSCVCRLAGAPGEAGAPGGADGAGGPERSTGSPGAGPSGSSPPAAAAHAGDAAPLRILLVFAGAEETWHALPRQLREAGHVVTAIDTRLGGAGHDVLRGGLGQLLLQATVRGDYDAVFLAPPCSSFSVRHPVRLWSAAWAVIAAICVGVGIVLAAGMHGALPAIALSPPVLIAPVLDAGTVLGLALPLYIVTMASQNLPGIAVLRADGYAPPVPAILNVTGALSVLTAPFGGHTTSLAAITAAICTGPDAHPDPQERWKGGLVYGAGYAGLALIGASVVVMAASLPGALITILAGLALIGPFMGALRAAFGSGGDSFPAALTFAVTASGVSFWSVGAPFWGLAFGLLAMALAGLRARAGAR